MPTTVLMGLLFLVVMGGVGLTIFTVHSLLKSSCRENIRQFDEMQRFILERLRDNESLDRHNAEQLTNQLARLSEAVERRLTDMRGTLDEQLRFLKEDHIKAIETIRNTVDEKLEKTLESRLGKSFELVSQQLERVYKGLGDMQTLAIGVGDLKKMLSNVKSRGTWGEVQLGALLSEALTPEQYEKNVQTKKGSAERVDFAIRLPGGDKNSDAPVWIPIDSKFPLEDYQRLQDALDRNDPAASEEAARQLEARIKTEGKRINEKYIDPPGTTDFAIMFLATEGLFAEVIRRSGLCEILHREYRITVAGPTTIMAFINSLQLGFRTLAIEKRSSEVWQLLGTIKTEFSRFGDLLERTQKKITEAGLSLESVASKTRTIEQKLKKVEQIPDHQAISIDHTEPV